MIKTFEGYLEDTQWADVKSHYSKFPDILEKNINEAITKTKIQRKILRKKLEESYDIKKQDLSLQKKLKKELYSGNVVGVDGTCSEYDLTLGYQAVIGIVAVNYINNKASYTTYISQPFIDEDIENAEDQMKYLWNKGMGKVGINSLQIRAIMLWKEREFVLNRPEKYKMIQGEILPYEMRTGQGKLRGLNTCLNLGKKMLNDDCVVAVQTSTERPELRWIGTLLESGEYVVLYDYAESLNEFLNGSDVKGIYPAHFKGSSDGQLFQDFIDEVRGKFVLGVYKLKNRAYVFYVPKNNIDNMVNLIFADSQYQPLRGFPLILDYADMMCARLVSTSDFKKMVEFKLARKNMLELEINERNLRRR